MHLNFDFDSEDINDLESQIQRATSNLEQFNNENIRPDYANGYTLIKGELATTGDIQIKEEIVFFIYENQIAGVKFISDCF